MGQTHDSSEQPGPYKTPSLNTHSLGHLSLVHPHIKPQLQALPQTQRAGSPGRIFLDVLEWLLSEGLPSQSKCTTGLMSKSSQTPTLCCSSHVYIFIRTFQIQCDGQMTCGLLLSEVIRRLLQRGEERLAQRAVSFKSLSNPKQTRSGYAQSLNEWFFRSGDDDQSTADQSRKSTVDLDKFVGRECLDFWLTCFERSVGVLRAFPQVKVIYCAIEDPTSDIALMGVPQSLQQLEIIQVIGKGGFSTVHAARSKIDGRLFALKSVRKTKIQGDQERIERSATEQRIHMAVDHPFLVRTYSLFQSRFYFHVLMEFCPGGQLFFHLNKHRPFPEEAAKFYFVEVLLGLKYLHDNQIVYRDLKPQNVLLDIDGHIKLTDFGLSKDNFTQKSRSFSICGSPEYMPPEMLQARQHSRTVDFYALGAFLYELLVGVPPFYSNNRAQMYRNILNSQLTFPKVRRPHSALFNRLDDISQEAKDLLRKLLHKHPFQRLGTEAGIQEVQKHKFCSGIDWSLVARRKFEPPIRPDFTRSNFDPEYTQLPARLSIYDDEETPCTPSNKYYIDIGSGECQEHLIKRQSSPGAVEVRSFHPQPHSQTKEIQELERIVVSDSKENRKMETRNQFTQNRQRTVSDPLNASVIHQMDENAEIHSPKLLKKKQQQHQASRNVKIKNSKTSHHSSAAVRSKDTMMRSTSGYQSTNPTGFSMISNPNQFAFCPPGPLITTVETDNSSIEASFISQEKQSARKEKSKQNRQKSKSKLGKATASRDRFQQGKTQTSKSKYGSRRPTEVKRPSISKEIKFQDIVKQAAVNLSSKTDVRHESARREAILSMPFYTQSNTPISHLIPDPLDQAIKNETAHFAFAPNMKKKPFSSQKLWQPQAKARKNRLIRCDIHDIISQRKRKPISPQPRQTQGESREELRSPREDKYSEETKRHLTHYQLKRAAEGTIEDSLEIAPLSSHSERVIKDLRRNAMMSSSKRSKKISPPKTWTSSPQNAKGSKFTLPFYPNVKTKQSQPIEKKETSKSPKLPERLDSLNLNSPKTGSSPLLSFSTEVRKNLLRSQRKSRAHEHSAQIEARHTEVSRRTNQAAKQSLYRDLMGEKQSNVMVENMPNPLIHTPESMQHKHSLSINQSISLLGQKERYENCQANVSSFLLEPSESLEERTFIRGELEQAPVNYNTAHFQSNESPVCKMVDNLTDSFTEIAPSPLTRSHIHSIVLGQNDPGSARDLKSACQTHVPKTSKFQLREFEKHAKRKTAIAHKILRQSSSQALKTKGMTKRGLEVEKPRTKKSGGILDGARKERGFVILQSTVYIPESKLSKYESSGSERINLSNSDVCNTDRALLRNIAKKNEAKRQKVKGESLASKEGRKAKFSKFLLSDRP